MNRNKAILMVGNGVLLAALALGCDAADEYGGAKYDQVFLAYAKFVSVLKSQPTVVQLLPFEKPATAEKTAKTAYQFEPDAEELLGTLLPQYVEVLIYRAIVESLASEQAAQLSRKRGAVCTN